MSTLPAGWTLPRLSEVCLPVKKTEPISTGRATVRYVDIGSVDGSTHSLTEIASIDSRGAPSRARQVLRKGDTVFSTVRPYLEKIAYIDAGLDGEFASTGFCVLRPSAAVEPRYLFHYAVSPGMLEQVLVHQRGVSYPAVLDKDVRSATIPLPGLAEQRRIAEILDDHFSRLDAGARGLAAATMRLRALVASQIEMSKSDAAKCATALPLGDLAIDARYGTSTKCVAGGPGPAVVRIPNLVQGSLDLSDEKRVQDGSLDVTSVMLQKDDLLIVRTNGSRDLIGRTAVVPPGVNAAFASYLIRYRLDTSRVRPAWAHLMMRAPSTRRALESMAASSAGQYNLSLQKLDRICIPVPDLTLQDRLLRASGSVVDGAARTNAAVANATARGASLRRAVLSAAFSGQLADGRRHGGEFADV